MPAILYEGRKVHKSEIVLVRKKVKQGVGKIVANFDWLHNCHFIDTVCLASFTNSRDIKGDFLHNTGGPRVFCKEVYSIFFDDFSMMAVPRILLLSADLNRYAVNFFFVLLHSINRVQDSYAYDEGISILVPGGVYSGEVSHVF